MQDFHTQAVFPIIFDDSPDQVTDGRLGHGRVLDEGLLAKVDVETALLSMSNYGKSQYSNTKGKLESAVHLCPVCPKIFITSIEGNRDLDGS